MHWFRAGLALAFALCLSATAGAASVQRMVDVGGGVQLSVTTAGPATDKPALALITGWRVTQDVWGPQIEALSKDRQVIAFDPRSQGRSTVTGEGVTPEQRARDLQALLDALSVRSVVLVGWSQGVQDVAAYLGQFGTGRVAGVVLVDAPISDGAAGVTAAPEAAARQLNMLSLYGRIPRDYTEGMLHAIISRPLPPAQFQAIADQAMRTPTAIGVAMLVADLLGPDRTGVIARLDRPALVIAASRSPEIEAQRAMAACLPNGRFAVMAEASHAVFIDQPDAFNALLSGFLAKISAPGLPTPGTAARTGRAPGATG
jgi:microsomal epoxide hydrolase